LPSLLSSGFTSNFWFYDYYYIIGAYILPYHLYTISPISCSCLIIPCVFPTWYHLLFLYLLLYACAHDTIFNAWLWLRFIDTRVLIFARHLAFASPLLGEFRLPWILMSRSQSLELVNSSSCWLEMHNGSVDHRRSVQSPIFPAPLLGSRVFLLWFWALICTFYDCISLVFSHLCLSGDVIFL